uniref:Uncharacterized protein n=1 Tax=Alexandrium monilatum TaxID=311494 RepID=A0A7S4W2A0_9DINO
MARNMAGRRITLALMERRSANEVDSGQRLLHARRSSMVTHLLLPPSLALASSRSSSKASSRSSVMSRTPAEDHARDLMMRGSSEPWQTYPRRGARSASTRSPALENQHVEEFTDGTRLLLDNTDGWMFCVMPTVPPDPELQCSASCKSRTVPELLTMARPRTRGRSRLRSAFLAPRSLADTISGPHIPKPPEPGALTSHELDRMFESLWKADTYPAEPKVCESEGCMQVQADDLPVPSPEDGEPTFIRALKKVDSLLERVAVPKEPEVVRMALPAAQGAVPNDLGDAKLRGPWAASGVRSVRCGD